MIYNIDFEIASLVFLLVMSIIYLFRKNDFGMHTRIIHYYWVSTILSICLNIFTCYTIAEYESFPLGINYLLNAAYLSSQCILPVFFGAYVYSLVETTHLKKLTLILCSIPSVIANLLTLSSVWTGAVFYFDDTGYHHGSLFSCLYINIAFYVILALGIALYPKNNLHMKQRITIFLLVSLAVLPVMVQAFLPTYLLTGLGGTLTVLIMVLTNDSMITFKDATTGALNREAFLMYIQEYNEVQIPVQIYAIALDNFKIINEMYGMEGGNLLMQMLVTELQNEYDESQVFRFSGDTFTIVLEEKTESIKELTRINRILNSTWYLDDNDVHLTACIGLTHSIDHKDSDLLKAIEYSVTCAKELGKGRFFEVNEAATKAMERRSAIEQAIMENIADNTFEVHYQPIFDTQTMRFHSMEALARLHVDGFGYISPEEFVKIAENNGTILKIGLLVLEEVCRFIKEYNLKERGIDYVEVNLSVVQCTQEAIVQDVLSVIEKYQIPPSMINLEITESAAASSQKVLIRNLARMALSDITFSLDDYGSGYSNINYLVDLPFSIVKLDKYIVWAAFEKVTSRKILENTVTMFKYINLKIVAEGIEDINMARTLTRMGIDYLQGFYFSRPVPKEKLVQILDSDYLDTLLEKNPLE